jgi:T5SS/PEP-CTERM-associated repeat protein
MLVDAGSQVTGDTVKIGVGNPANFGELTVTGASTRYDVSLDVVVGYWGGAGRLTVSDGASLQADDIRFEGEGPTEGIFTGKDTTVRSDVLVGADKGAELRILDGATLYGGFKAGNSSGEPGSVLIDNASVIHDGDILVGRNGSGQLTMRNGASLKADYLQVSGGSTFSGQTGGPGTADIDGIGTTVDVRYLAVGNSQGPVDTMRITNGAEVTVETHLALCRRKGSHGRLEIRGQGSSLSVGGDLDITFLSGASEDRSRSTVVLADGGLLSSDGDGGVLGNLGELDLVFEIGDNGPGKLAINGRTECYGPVDLVIELQEAVTLHNGQVFDLMDVDFSTSNPLHFASVQLPDLSGYDPAWDWDTSNLTMDGTVQIVPEPAMMSLLALGGVALLRRRRR